MAKKPDAARGKTTRKGTIRKILKKYATTGRPPARPGMSPGAMGGPTPPKRLTKLTPESRTRTNRGIIGKAAKAMGTAAMGPAAGGLKRIVEKLKAAKKTKPGAVGRSMVADFRKNRAKGTRAK